MRGKEPTDDIVISPVRITPAYAGKSRRSSRYRSVNEDHPRVCGEKSLLLSRMGREWGSPPRMRGKVSNRIESAAKRWITPAYAGKSLVNGLCSALYQDHPRVCGEKESARPAKPAVWGSPPRMRGKGMVKTRDTPQYGITPAYAGKSFAFRQWRECSQGSPPRMRGKVDIRAAEVARIRITPAYAGKRLCRLLIEQAVRDHPRVCGEKRLQHGGSHRGLGSPPRMRGKGYAPQGQRSDSGITPAYAGKRTRMAMSRTQRRDHPRVCGEKSG